MDDTRREWRRSTNNTVKRLNRQAQLETRKKITPQSKLLKIDRSVARRERQTKKSRSSQLTLIPVSIMDLEICLHSMGNPLAKMVAQPRALPSLKVAQQQQPHLRNWGSPRTPISPRNLISISVIQQQTPIRIRLLQMQLT